MANAKLVPEGRPPTLGHIDGPAKTWIPQPETIGGDAGLARELCGMVDLQRCAEKGIGALMGKAWRHPVTGEVQLKGFGSFQDFCVADLWTRPFLHGTTDLLVKDPYLFKPIPMTMRTWIYHYMFRNGIQLDTTGAAEDTMIRHVLNLQGVDADTRMGRWTPIMLYVPMIIFLCASADIAAVIVGIVILNLVIFINMTCNNPELYRFARPLSFPFRLVLFIYIIQRMGSQGGEEECKDGKCEEGGPSAMTTVSFLFSLLLCFGEMVWGDGGAICAYRLHCNYEIIRPLPNRIFVCRRHGAAHSSDILGRSLPVNEKITGIGGWQEDMVLIADVKGLIMELRPMGKDDWKMIFLEKQSNEDIVHRYVGLDVYSPGAATIDALEAVIKELADAKKLADAKRAMHDNVELEDA